MNVTQSGDTVIVSAGVYHEYVYVNKSITLISNGATIDGVNASGTVTDGLVSVVASNVKFQGFTISNAKTYGLANFGNNSQFTNNVIHNTQGAGIWMRDGSLNIFDGNELYDTVLQNSTGFDGMHYICSPTSTDWPSAINSWGAANSNTWRNNNIHDNCGEGIVTIAGDLVENNTFKNNWSIEIYIANYGSVVRNNTIVDTKPYTPHGSDQSWRNLPAGIAIGDESVCLSDNNTITGNNITGARYGISFYQYISCSGVKNTLIENNTIINAWEYGLRILSGAHTNSTIHNNIVQLSSGKPLTIQNGGFVVTGNTLSSNTNVFEWNGKSYDFTGWNNVVPGNFWGTAGTATTTSTPAPTTQVTPTATFSLPTATVSTLIPTMTVAATLTPNSTGPAATITASPIPASPTNTQISVPPTATLTALVVPASPAITSTSIPPTATPTTLVLPASPTVASTSVPPTATSVVINQPATGTVFDDRDGGLVYSPGWKNDTNRQAYQRTFKFTAQNGAYVTLTFTGQSFSVIYKSGSSYRKMNVYVDNILVGTIDENAFTSAFQQRWDFPGQLTPGSHTLKLVFVTTDTSKTYGSIDAVIVR